MKILNLYAGIGGNRKLWGDKHKVTAIEIDPNIAKIYQDFFPNDKIIICDAHEYLLKNFKEFDFIWSSPPCPSHSMMRKNMSVASGQNKAIYPDMKLYEEILLLMYYFKGKWVVENVKSYYDPFIKPIVLHRHYIWSNFDIPIIKFSVDIDIRRGLIPQMQESLGFDLSEYKNIDKRKILRNCVKPKMGLHILKCSKNNHGTKNI